MVFLREITEIQLEIVHSGERKKIFIYESNSEIKIEEEISEVVERKPREYLEISYKGRTRTLDIGEKIIKIGRIPEPWYLAQDGFLDDLDLLLSRDKALFMIRVDSRRKEETVPGKNLTVLGSTIKCPSWKFFNPPKDLEIVDGEGVVFSPGMLNSEIDKFHYFFFPDIRNDFRIALLKHVFTQEFNLMNNFMELL